MEATYERPRRIEPSASTVGVVAALFAYEHARDAHRVLFPRPEVHVVVRVGPSALGGLDVHAMGVRQTTHRKHIRGKHDVVMARLRLGAAEEVLGVSPAELADRTVPLGELWGEDVVRVLRERLAAATSLDAKAALLERAIADRIAASTTGHAHASLALNAAAKLTSANVTEVATDLGVSERHLRRVFREALGLSPKAFAKLARFSRALQAARNGTVNWASIAATSGYYDQAHLIAEFRAIAGTTPKALLGELRTTHLAE